VGPTADGFETYGVTGVALVSFIVLAVGTSYQKDLLVWIFVMRILMIITSIAAFYINKAISQALYHGKDDMDFEQPLTHLVWITSILSIIVTFAVSYLMIGPLRRRSRAEEPLGDSVNYHQLRNTGSCSHPRIHQNIHKP
jgi:K(+)-stimulated pyrophosphate-energized sodium pump